MGTLSPEALGIGLERAMSGLTEGYIRSLLSSEGLKGQRDREIAR